MNLTKDDLVAIHKIVQKRFSVIAGIRSIGILDSIANRPDQIVSGHISYPDIYMKAASIMEGIIRLHPFADGNKRTGLLATYVYFNLNGFVCIFPLHSVRKSVMIAKEQGIEQESIDKLIIDIADWLKKYSAPKSDNEMVINISKNFMKENQDLIDLFNTDPEQAGKIYDEWLAIDIYPEYEKEREDILQFLFNLNKVAIT